MLGEIKARHRETVDQPGAFPVVHAIFLAAFYLPVALLLVVMILRGVAFEFRSKGKGHRCLWHIGFVLGSIIAAFVLFPLLASAAAWGLWRGVKPGETGSPG